jgi:hypothetical protein
MTDPRMHVQCRSSVPADLVRDHSLGRRRLEFPTLSRWRASKAVAIESVFTAVRHRIVPTDGAL